MAALQRTAGNETLSHCGKGWVMQPELTPAKCNLKAGSREESFLLGKWFHNFSQQVFSTQFFLSRILYLIHKWCYVGRVKQSQRFLVIEKFLSSLGDIFSCEFWGQQNVSTHKQRLKLDLAGEGDLILSTLEKPGAAEALGSNRETAGNCLKGIRKYSKKRSLTIPSIVSNSTIVYLIFQLSKDKVWHMMDETECFIKNLSVSFLFKSKTLPLFSSHVSCSSHLFMLLFLDWCLGSCFNIISEKISARNVLMQNKVLACF